MIVRYTRRATSDLESILSYLKALSPSGAASIAAAVKASILQPGENPQSGRVVADTLRVHPVTRYPYLVFYRVGIGHVSIIHIRHAARSPYP